MTSFACRTCGRAWTEGPTRDHKTDQQCRGCLGERLALMDNALDTYGQHTVHCSSHTTQRGRWLPCDCGWEDHPLNSKETL